MKYYLLTCHGALLQGSGMGFPLGSVALDGVSDRSLLAAIDLPVDVAGFPFADFLANAMPEERDVTVRHFSQQALKFDRATKTVMLERNGLLLSAEPSGRIVQDRRRAGAWERLMLIGDSDLDWLQRLYGSTWIRRSDRALIPAGRIVTEFPASLRVGSTSIPLAFNLPFPRDGSPFRWHVLRDGWRIDELLLFRPLIFYVACGADALRQLVLSVRSLIKLGRYDGEIVAFTDTETFDRCGQEAELLDYRVRLVPIRASDRVAFVAARYAILDEPSAYQHQPVLYVDTDVVFNAEVAPMLKAIALSDRICAPLEPFGDMRTTPGLGASLFREDELETGSARGFNCGTLGIPNLAEHGSTLETIRRIIQNFFLIRGRHATNKIDQPIANYVSHKLFAFNTKEISGMVRFGGAELAVEPGPSTGLVHFWPAREQREDVMRRYLDALFRRSDLAADGAVPSAHTVRTTPETSASNPQSPAHSAEPAFP